MRILVTGSAGHLGEGLMRTLRATEHEAVGLDVKPSPFTQLVGSITDRDFVRECMRGVGAVIHTATLHKPHIATHTKQDFVDVNITGTLNLLEELEDVAGDRASVREPGGETAPRMAAAIRLSVRVATAARQRGFSQYTGAGCRVEGISLRVVWGGRPLSDGLSGGTGGQRMNEFVTQTVGAYTLSDDPGRLDLKAMHAYLRRAYWSEEIPFEVVERAARASLCIGAYDATGAQVGLTRLISDYATFCYVCDVYVLEEHRGRGLSKAMMAMAMSHPRLQGLRRWNLVTKDAHGLYRQFGFKAPALIDRYMERTDPEIYKRLAAERGA